MLALLRSKKVPLSAVSVPLVLSTAIPLISSEPPLVARYEPAFVCASEVKSRNPLATSAAIVPSLTSPAVIWPRPRIVCPAPWVIVRPLDEKIPARLGTPGPVLLLSTISPLPAIESLSPKLVTALMPLLLTVRVPSLTSPSAKTRSSPPVSSRESSAPMRRLPIDRSTSSVTSTAESPSSITASNVLPLGSPLSQFVPSVHRPSPLNVQVLTWAKEVAFNTSKEAVASMAAWK